MNGDNRPSDITGQTQNSQVMDKLGKVPLTTAIQDNDHGQTDDLDEVPSEHVAEALCLAVRVSASDPVNGGGDGRSSASSGASAGSTSATASNEVQLVVGGLSQISPRAAPGTLAIIQNVAGSKRTELKLM